MPYRVRARVALLRPKPPRLCVKRGAANGRLRAEGRYASVRAPTAFSADSFHFAAYQRATASVRSRRAAGASRMLHRTRGCAGRVCLHPGYPARDIVARAIRKVPCRAGQRREGRCASCTARSGAGLLFLPPRASLYLNLLLVTLLRCKPLAISQTPMRLQRA
eukprot:TRINITY_DN1150_c0_g2_i1.p2 TRINITY_DN1150_c0_g2~~TRINITY_DN1150_c0_g2_i1.p2  ORF type:complete len:163 (+),score=12.58 TRINITY_DN1150_c0_g2_i1:466-954(+)